MSPLPVIGGSGGGISASYLNQLIEQTMSLHRQPLTMLKKEQDTLQLRRAVYNDLKSLLESFKTEVQKLGTGSASVTGQKSVTLSETGFLTAGASSSAGAGAYEVHVTQLAEAHQVRSGRQARTDTALGLTAGQFSIGGREQRITDVPSGSTLILAAAAPAADPTSGHPELASGDHYFEFQKQSDVWMFRLVDQQGRAVSIRKGASADEYTSEWQKFEDVDGGDYDTGRGLKVAFGSVDQLTTDVVGATAANKVSYHAKGAAISVGPNDTLKDLRDKINKATYAAGNEVSAAIIDNQLVLSAKNTGYQLEFTDAPTDGPLARLDLVGNGDADGDGWSHTLAGWDAVAATVKLAKLDVGAMKGLTAWSNTGITNLIEGVTLNLTKKTTAPITVTVADDNTAVTNQINAVTNQFNKLTAYLADKTKVTKDGDGKYTYGPLATDSVMTRLRMDLISVMVKPAGAGSLRSLREIGVTVNVDTMQFSLTDSAKLASQLQTNRQGVVDMLGGVMKAVEDRLSTFTGSDGVLASSVKRMEGDDQALTKQVKSMEERLSAQEMLLTRQYARTLAALAEVQSQSSYIYGLTATLNQLG